MSLTDTKLILSLTKKQLNNGQNKMLQEGIVPATGLRYAPLVIVKKHYGEPRICVTFCGLNQLIVND